MLWQHAALRQSARLRDGWDRPKDVDAALPTRVLTGGWLILVIAYVVRNMILAFHGRSTVTDPPACAPPGRSDAV